MARSAMTRMRRHTASAATRCSHRRSTTTPTRQSIRTTRTRTRLPLSTTLPSNPRAAPSPHSLSPRLHPRTTRAFAAACTPTRAHSRHCAVRTTWTRRQRIYSVSTHSHSTTRAWAWAARARPIFRVLVASCRSVSTGAGRRTAMCVVMDARRKALAPSSALRHRAARSHGCGHSGRRVLFPQRPVRTHSLRLHARCRLRSDVSGYESAASARSQAPHARLALSTRVGACVCACAHARRGRGCVWEGPGTPITPTPRTRRMAASRRTTHYSPSD